MLPRRHTPLARSLPTRMARALPTRWEGAGGKGAGTNGLAIGHAAGHGKGAARSQPSPPWRERNRRNPRHKVWRAALGAAPLKLAHRAFATRRLAPTLRQAPGRALSARAGRLWAAWRLYRLARPQPTKHPAPPLPSYGASNRRFGRAPLRRAASLWTARALPRLARAKPTGHPAQPLLPWRAANRRPGPAPPPTAAPLWTAWRSHCLARAQPTRHPVHPRPSRRASQRCPCSQQPGESWEDTSTQPACGPIQG